MSVTIRYLAVGEEANLVLDWFRRQPLLTTEADRPDGKWFHFGGIGPLGPSGQPDPEHSPVAYVVVPKLLRNALWTVGEIGFPATPLEPQFPKLHRVLGQLKRWLRQFEQVFDTKQPGACEWNYYLEGGVLNVMADVYALPDAAKALRQGQYFVPDGISEGRLYDVCAALRLRGVGC
jgi:hypothetical protein